ncbi:MAG: hypothetical protein QXV69_00405 [Sulfolobaceae archaeon]
MNKRNSLLLTSVSQTTENNQSNEFIRNIYKYIYYKIKNEKKEKWDNIVVYIDLKLRGRNPIKGPIENSWFIPKGSNKVGTLVYVLNENTSINPRDFFELLELSKRMRVQLVLAIVDMYGDITYYTLSEVSLVK